MSFKLLKNIVFVVGVFGLSCVNISVQEFINALNDDYYGFEVSSGDDGWWMQQPENFSIETNKGAKGSGRSLKYTNATAYTGSKKAFGSTTIDEMLIDLEAGIYDMKAMVWVATGANISNIKINFRTAGLSDVNVVFNLSAVNKNQWVEVSAQLNLTSDFVDTNVRIMMDSGYGGTGTMYFDDLQILVEAPPVVEEIPSSAQIVTMGNENLSLDKGHYQMSLKVWVDENATMKNFYTYIVEPWVATKWEIDGVAKNQWVELKTEIDLNADAVDSQFQIKVNNNPDYGGGKGVFYIDDIYIIKAKNAYEDNDNFTIQVTGETCFNANNGKISISAKHLENYNVEFNGENYSFSDELIIENLVPNTYNLCVSVNNTTFKSCYTVVVKEGNTISGKISNRKSNAILVKIDDGTAPFTVSINGAEVLTTLARTFEVESEIGGLLEVKSNKDCEGLLVKNIEMLSNVKIYPNPANNVLNVLAPANSNIKLYNILGKVVLSKSHISQNYKISLSNIVAGIYIVKVVSNKKVFTEKVVIK